jgi:single-strand DNA-binding protein
MNKAILLGNLGEDPELRHTQSGTAVMNLRLATTDRYKDNDGQWQERTDWHTVVVWGNRAESLSKFLRKGSKLLVEGSVQTRSYEGRDGQKKYSTEINAKEIELCDKRESGGQQQPNFPQPDRQQRQPAPPQAPAGFGPGDDDVPFR